MAKYTYIITTKHGKTAIDGKSFHYKRTALKYKSMVEGWNANRAFRIRRYKR